MKYIFKLIDLPEPSTWNKTLLKTYQDKLMIRMVGYGFFFNSETDYTKLRCVIAPRGYLVIYANESLKKGYAFKLRDAHKFKIHTLNRKLVNFNFY